MRSLSRLAAACLVVGSLPAGCAQHRPDEAPGPSTPIMAIVANDAGLDADVYAVGSGGRYHLGVVPVGVTATLYIPSYIVGSGTLRLFVHRPSASEWWTPAVHVRPGDQTELQLTSPIQRSTFGVAAPE
jgi:hypothetical protein